MSNPFRIAEQAFRDTLERLGLSGTEPEFADPALLGRRAALLATASIVWRRHLGPLLDAQQVQELMRVNTTKTVRGFVRRRRLLALPMESGELRYPAFQFGPTGRPHRILPKVLEIFAETDADPHTPASWFKTRPGCARREVAGRVALFGRRPAPRGRSGAPDGRAPEVVSRGKP